MPNEIAFGLGLLLMIGPLALLLKLFKTYKSHFPSLSANASTVLLMTIISFAYCVLVGLTGYYFSKTIGFNQFVIPIIGYSMLIAIYGALLALCILLATVILMTLVQLSGWTRRRFHFSKKD
jgi:hypothetical protein